MDRQCPTPPVMLGGMNMKKMIGFGTRPGALVIPAGCRVIAAFGPARLVRRPDGRHELLGGTEAERAQAREWCSLFAAEVVFSTPPPPPGTLTLVA